MCNMNFRVHSPPSNVVSLTTVKGPTPIMFFTWILIRYSVYGVRFSMT